MGSVTFYDDGSSLGTATLAGGMANFTTSSFAVGDHTISAVYGGNANCTGSTGSLTGNNPQVVLVPQGVGQGAPSAPTLTAMTPSADGPVTLSWTAPASSGTSSVTSYEVFGFTSNTAATLIAMPVKKRVGLDEEPTEAPAGEQSCQPGSTARSAGWREGRLTWRRRTATS